MGSIEQLPSQRWRGIARNPQTGQRRSKTFDTAVEADAWWKATERDWDGLYAQHGITVTRQVRGIKRWTLGEWAEHYLAEAEIAETTRANYRYFLRALRDYFGDARMLTDITRSDITGWLAAMREAGRSNHHRRSALIVARIMLRAAVEADVLPADPTFKVKLPKLDPTVERVLTEVEFAAVLAHLPAPMRALALLGFDSGLRWGEAAALSVERINLLHRRVTVVDHLRRDGTVQHHTKGRNRREVPLTARTVAALTEHMREHPPINGMLFTSSRRRPWSPWAVNQAWIKACKAAELAAPRPRWHDLRHSFGTRLAAHGVPVREIMDLMGHADQQVTQRYIKAAAPATREAWLRFALEGGPSPLAM